MIVWAKASFDVGPWVSWVSSFLKRVMVLLSEPKPMPSSPIWLAMTQSQFLLWSLSLALASRFSLSAAKPTTNCDCLRSPMVFKMSMVLARWIVRLAVSFLTFCSVYSIGVKSLTAAAIMQTSQTSKSASTWWYISSAETTG